MRKIHPERRNRKLESKRIPRLRIIAGPNGSGKSTFFQLLKQKVPTGVWLNADEIEETLSKNGFLNFKTFGCENSGRLFSLFLAKNFEQRTGKQSTEIENWLKIENNVIVLKKRNGKLPYLSALITDFIRGELLNHKIDFTFETVFSHPEKILFLKKALKNGYRVYLYFLSTNSPFINEKRVNNRTKKGGHSVPKEKIMSRYGKSIQNGKTAAIISFRAYFIDNSDNLKIIAEKLPDGNWIKKSGTLPSWFSKMKLMP